MLDDCPSKQHTNNDNEFDKFDDEQFLSMFNDEIAGVHNMPPTLSSSNPSSPSDQNFFNDDNETNKQEKKEMKKEEGY
ncbi:transcription factor RF2b-like, partial [Trifolium medium]|nr:transcription factor RF2b-like [Trifolium medium]